MSSWLEAKMSLLFLYFQSVQVTNSRTWDCWLEFVSSCVHNPNHLSLNLFGSLGVHNMLYFSLLSFLLWSNIVKKKYDQPTNPQNLKMKNIIWQA